MDLELLTTSEIDEIQDRFRENGFAFVGTHRWYRLDIESEERMRSAAGVVHHG